MLSTIPASAAKGGMAPLFLAQGRIRFDECLLPDWGILYGSIA
ncbi:MAG: hypothetical protein OXD01_00900 [Gammaproteobacteria bacterium]|nr:hypothetical protein [Gammaproteobacteria bacterium]